MMTIPFASSLVDLSSAAIFTIPLREQLLDQRVTRKGKGRKRKQASKL